MAWILLAVSVLGLALLVRRVCRAALRQQRSHAPGLDGSGPGPAAVPAPGPEPSAPCLDSPKRGASLNGQTLVLTGTLASMTRKQASERIVAAGGRVTGAISRHTTLVICGTRPGSKLEKARSLSLPILDEAGLLALLEGDHSIQP
ncbi:MAG: BRCT domain-containing protein [Synechococcaceae cyanobacterium]|nr:BRCT domain-containing protein [Synechococcaceae cyanobacterium]